MKPLVHLSFGAAYRVWTGMTILLVLGSVLIVLRMCDVTFDGRLALLLGVGLFSYIAFLDTLYNGQIGGVILLLLTVGVWALSDDRMGLSAFCFAVATLIKLTPVLAVPLFVFHRRWKWLIAYAAGLICLLIFSGWQAGWMIQNQFWHEVLPSISNGAPGFPNLSIVAFLREVSAVSLPLIESAPRALQAHLSGIPRIVAFLAYLLVLGRCFLRRHQRALVTDVVIVGLVAIVVSPVAWRHHFTTALLPFLYLGFRVPRKLYPLLIALLIAVGTDILVFVRALLPGPYVPAVLTAIVPGLTIALAYALLAPSREMPPGPRKRSSEVRRFVDA